MSDNKNIFSFSIDATPILEKLKEMDPYGLLRFIKAQESDYQTALKEIKNGHKESHWMWYIFPQLKGLGNSGTANYYGISNLEEAKAYYNNYLLNSNLLEISNALLELDNDNIEEIIGYPDNLKLQSCMTLFEIVDDNEQVFKKILKKYYNDKRDQKTIDMLKDN